MLEALSKVDQNYLLKHFSWRKWLFNRMDLKKKSLKTQIFLNLLGFAVLGFTVKTQKFQHK